MGIFSNSSPFDDVVGKATLETNTKEDWALILDICDRVGTTTAAPKECLRAIVRRLNHQDPHVVVQAILLLDACVSNCGLAFHLEIASRDFEQEFCKLIQKIPEKTVRDKLLLCLQKWADNEFKSDPQLDLIPSLVTKLKSKGVDFPLDGPHKTKKSSHHHKTRDSSAGSSSAAGGASSDDADLAKAIELSLKEAQANNQSKSLYPQTSVEGRSNAINEEKEARKVRALYDFEAAEENELTFYAGEIVFVTDDTDTNWWHGSNQRGKGLFPANFVSADLSLEPSKFGVVTKKTVQFSEDVEVQSVETEPEVVEIDEAKIDKCLNMLHEADPTGELQDPVELAGLEDHVNQMGPLIDQELEKIDRRHAQLTRLGGELVEALNMYHNLMREPVGMGQQSMPYNVKMDMNVPGGMSPMPQFPPVNGSMQYPAGYSPYDPNVPYSMMRPQTSAPPNGAQYNSMPYQPPQNNGMGQGNMGNQQMVNPMNIPNGQIPPQQMPQQPPTSQQQNMNMGLVGQIPYPQQMMMSPGQNLNMQPQGPAYLPNPNPMSQAPIGMPQQPHMQMPHGVPQQQFIPQSSQMYPQSPSAAPNSPAV